jgi:hypothetical protein
MFKRRRTLILVALALLVCICGQSLHTFGRRSCVSPEQCDRIQPGMSLDEVVAILGCPPGNHTAFDGFARWDGTSGGFSIAAQPDCQDWFVDCRPARVDESGYNLRHEAILVRVRFDEYAKVCDVLHDSAGHYLSPAPFARVRLWLAYRAAELGF